MARCAKGLEGAAPELVNVATVRVLVVDYRGFLNDLLDDAPLTQRVFV